MTQQVKVIVTHTGNLNPVSKSYMVEQKQLPWSECPLIFICHDTYTKKNVKSTLLNVLFNIHTYI